MIRPNNALLKAYANGRRKTPPFRPTMVPVNSVLEGKDGQMYELGWVASNRPLRANGINLGYLTQDSSPVGYRVAKRTSHKRIISIAMMVVYTYLVVYHKLPQWGKTFTNQSVNQTMMNVYAANTSFRNQLLHRGYDNAAVEMFANWGLRMMFVLIKLIPVLKTVKSVKDWQKFVPLVFSAFMNTYWSPITLSNVRNNQHKRRNIARSLQENVQIMLGFIIHMVVEENIQLLVQGIPVPIDNKFKSHLKKAYEEGVKFLTK